MLAQFIRNFNILKSDSQATLNLTLVYGIH